VGKATAPLRLPDPVALVEVATARDHAAHAAHELATAVCRATQAGHPWSAIDVLLNMSRQGAQQRFARFADRLPTAPPTDRGPMTQLRSALAALTAAGARLKDRLAIGEPKQARPAARTRARVLRALRLPPGRAAQSIPTGIWSQSL
jgi:hypothetical protein